MSPDQPGRAHPPPVVASAPLGETRNKEKIVRRLSIIVCSAILAVITGCATPGDTGSAPSGQDDWRPADGYRGAGGY